MEIWEFRNLGNREFRQLEISKFETSGTGNFGIREFGDVEILKLEMP